ncbi:MAG TPA: YsnF/AvaK domain-containing protein [Chitinophagaceae bacterium]|jgi:uncharacterized protein (TIGR02271 family)|nr:YsnF/AvaK domain-containing protein [Chitinophagaceae bacterium]
MAQTVVGFFDDASDARKAVEQLVSNGFDRDQIDISEQSGNVSGTHDADHDRGSENGVTRFFKSLFGDDNDDADRYATVGSRSTIVSVLAQSGEEAERAADLLDDNGAINVNERASSYGYTGNARSTEEEFRGVSSDRETSIPRIEENLEVGKREVETGGVRVRSRIVERPVEEHIRLRQEHVHVERNPVNRPVSESDLNNLQDRDIELTERSEVPVVNKEARVTEEIRISKDVDTRDETIRENLRHTDIDIERTGSENDLTGRSQSDTDITGGYNSGRLGNDLDDDDLNRDKNSRF